jgi:site-specific DNA-methyltransferase (adenine-specific)
MDRGEIMTIELLHMDCMDYMRGLPDKAFDLAITDPPYGIGIDGQKETVNKARNPKQNRKAHAGKGWDNEIPNEQYFRELERVSKNQIIWGANYFVEHLIKGKKGWIVWDKGQHGLTMSDCELAYSSFDKPTRVWVQNRCILNQDGTIHPTQKPVKLYQWLLTNYAKPGDRILDTHLGSGSSAIAAHRMGFDFVGMELEADYYAAAVQRFERETAQVDMFKSQS